MPKARAAQSKKKAAPKQAAKPLPPHKPAVKLASQGMSNLVTNVPAPFFTGQALGVYGIVRDTLTLGVAPSANKRAMYFITNCGTTSTVAAVMTWQSTDTTTPVGTAVLNVPLIGAADDAGGPTSGRAQKCTWSIHVTTPMLSRGSAYYVANIDTRMLLAKAPSTYTANDANSLFTTLIGFPTTKAHDTAKDSYVRGSAHVTDFNDYNNFAEWDGNVTADSFMLHTSIWPTAVPNVRPMSTTVLIFDVPANPQSVIITVGARFYNRFPTDTIPGRMMVDLPLAQQHMINRLTRPPQVGGGAY